VSASSKVIEWSRDACAAHGNGRAHGVKPRAIGVQGTSAVAAGLKG